ncbi:MAG: AsmA family protein, partial [Bdellovibrionales bacterium]|nr:AsmA family protein [Bdellovibrionales bacterium]
MKKVVIAVLVLAIGCSICIWYLVSNLGEIAQYFRPQLERYVSELSGADIHFNRIDAHLFPQPTIQIQDIRVLQGPVHLSVDSLDLGLKVAPLIRRSLVISSLRVSKPIVRLSHETPTLTKTAEKGLPQAQAARSPASKDLTFALESFEVLDGVLQVENPLTESVLELKPIMIKGAVVSEPEGNEFLFSNLTVSLNQPVVQGEVRYVPNEQIVSCSFELQPIPLQYIAEIVRLASGDSLGEVTVARGQVLGSVGAKIITGVVHTAEADLEVRDVAGSWRTTRVEGGTSRVTIRLDGSNLDYEGSAKRVSLGNPGVNIDLSVEGSGPLSQIKSKALLTSAQWNVAELSSLFPSVRLYQKSYGLTGEGDVQLSGLFQGLDLDSFRFESRVKRAGMQFLNYPFRNIEGKVIATGGPSLESIQVNDGTVELGTKGEKVSFSGNFARSTSRLKGSIAGQGLT